MLKTLVRSRFQAMFYRKPKAGKRQKSMGPLYVGIFLYIFIVFGSLFVGAYSIFYNAFVTEIGAIEVYYALSIFTSMMLAFVGSVMMTQSQIYMAKDNELLLSMPIKPSAILLSRIIVLYVWAFLFSAVSLVPAMLVRMGRASLTVGEIIIFIIELFLVPLVSLTVSVLIGWLLQLLGNHVKNKSIFTIAGTFIFFAIYMAFCTRLNQIVLYAVERGDSIAKAFKTYLYPFYLCAEAIVSQGFLSILGMLAFTILPFAIAVSILSKTFIKIATAKSGIVKTEYKGDKMDTKSPVIAIAFKEMRKFVTSPQYAVNGGMGLVMQLLFAVYVAVKSDTILEIAAEIAEYGQSEHFLIVLVILLVASVGSISGISVASISLEGKNLWILKSAPIKSMDVLRGKLLANLFIAVPFSVLAGVAVNFMGYLSISERIFAFLLPTVITVFTAYYGLVINLKYPKLDWNNEVQAIKQSGAAFVAVFSGMGIMALVIALYMFTHAFLSGTAYLAIITFIFIAITVLLEYNLRHKGVKRFEEL